MKTGKSGIVKLTFACSFVIPEGVSLADVAGGGKGDPDCEFPNSLQSISENEAA